MKRIAFDLVCFVLASANDDPTAGRAHSARARLPVVDAGHELLVGNECGDELLFRMPARRQERCAGRSGARQDYEFASFHNGKFLVSSFWFLVRIPVSNQKPQTSNQKPTFIDDKRSNRCSRFLRGGNRCTNPSFDLPRGALGASLQSCRDTSCIRAPP